MSLLQQMCQKCLLTLLSYILLFIIYYNTLNSPLFKESPWIWSVPFRYNSVNKRQMQTISKQRGSRINKTTCYKETIYSFRKGECFLACICTAPISMEPFPRTWYCNEGKYLDSKQKIHLHTSSNPSSARPRMVPYRVSALGTIRCLVELKVTVGVLQRSVCWEETACKQLRGTGRQLITSGEKKRGWHHWKMRE